ncbi:hypothetical protein K0M31_017145 [Melipona bicolor]|uniref:Uncharacterized protein n=1 Tax=Melipona bicolor TaxID=60889 RepID=A0AA40FDF5_9HYME|nr:hypothetical protein K0M31_017145 [Melipona bicolor]
MSGYLPTSARRDTAEHGFSRCYVELGQTGEQDRSVDPTFSTSTCREIPKGFSSRSRRWLPNASSRSSWDSRIEETLLSAGFSREEIQSRRGVRAAHRDPRCSIQRESRPEEVRAKFERAANDNRTSPSFVHEAPAVLRAFYARPADCSPKVPLRPTARNALTDLQCAPACNRGRVLTADSGYRNPPSIRFDSQSSLLSLISHQL